MKLILKCIKIEIINEICLNIQGVHDVFQKDYLSFAFFYILIISM